MSKCEKGFSDTRAEQATGTGWLWECPNMKEREGDRSMEYEHYECKVCGERTKLDYDEMR